MLDKLFGSKSRAKLLKFFLFNPNEGFYIRQIARNLDLQVNSARRELNNLQELGLLSSGVAGGKKEGKKNQEKYYQVNKNFVLYEELRSLMVKAQVLYQKEFAENLKNVGDVKLVVLTGLFVNVDNSPIDLLVVGSIKKNDLNSEIKKMEENLGREINYTVMNLEEFQYRREITDIFLYNILENKRIIVIDEFGIS